MAKQRKKRQSYTAQQRTEILAAASQGKLTAVQVKRKYGVTPVTYYSWRKKAGASNVRGVAVASVSKTAAGSGTLESQMRAEVQSRVRQVLPAIVRSEVNNYLNTLFAGGPGRKGGQKV